MRTLTSHSNRLRAPYAKLLAAAFVALILLAAGCTGAPSGASTAQPTADQPQTGASTPLTGAEGAGGAPSSMGGVDAQNAATTLDSTSTGKGKIVLFDLAHSEIFGPTNTTPVGQSAAVARMRKAGLRVVATHTPYTEEMLKGVSGVIISGNMKPLETSELMVLQQFVSEGGVVFAAVHISPMDQSLAMRFGFGLTQSVLRTTSPGADGNPVNLTCTNIEKHPLTKDVTAVKVLGGWGLVSAPPSQIIVGTGADTWLDSDGDKQLTPADGRGPYGMVGARQTGKGMFIISGDDAVFANIALASKDNMQLFDNVVSTMKAAR
jgi:hypothetical protein